MQRLDPTKNRRECLQRHANQIVLGLLRGEAHTGGLCVKAQHPRSRVARLKTLPHDRCPESTCRSELGDLFHEIVVGVEEEGDLGTDAIHVQPRGHRRLHIGDAVGQRERYLLDCVEPASRIW